MSRSRDDSPQPVPHDPHEPYETVVDGETWIVRQRTMEPGVYDFDWVSGPNEDYGFTSATSNGSSSTKAELDESIRQFLSTVDPATGYVSDD